MRSAWFIVLTGCGRIAFDPQVDARSDGVLAEDGPAASDLVLFIRA